MSIYLLFARIWLYNPNSLAYLSFRNSSLIQDFDTYIFLILQYSIIWRHDTEHNDTQHNDTQHNDIQHNDTQHNGTQHNDTQHNDT
jgi:hypothetical protein